MNPAALLRHQFTASSLWRLLYMLPTGAMLTAAIVRLHGNVFIQLVGPAMLTLFLFGILLPEEDTFTAYGVPRQRALKAVAWVAVPAVLVSAAVGLFSRPDWIGVLGALGAAVAGCALGARYLPQADPADTKSSRAGELGNRSLVHEVIWSPHLLWAVLIACALNLTFYLTSFIDAVEFRTFLAGLPLLIWYCAHASATADSPGPQHAAAFGIPRKTWIANIVGAAAASVAIFAVLAYVVNRAVAGLLDLPQLPLTAIAVAAAGAFAVIVGGAGGRIRFSTPQVLCAFLMYFVMSDLLDIHGEPNGTLAIASLVIAGAIFTFGAVLLALYASGKIDLKRDKDAFTGV